MGRGGFPGHSWRMLGPFQRHRRERISCPDCRLEGRPRLGACDGPGRIPVSGDSGETTRYLMQLADGLPDCEGKGGGRGAEYPLPSLPAGLSSPWSRLRVRGRQPCGVDGDGSDDVGVDRVAVGIRRRDVDNAGTARCRQGDCGGFAGLLVDASKLLRAGDAPCRSIGIDCDVGSGRSFCHGALQFCIADGYQAAGRLVEDVEAMKAGFGAHGSVSSIVGQPGS